MRELSKNRLYTAAIQKAYDKGQGRTPLPEGYKLDSSFGNQGYFRGKSGVQAVAIINERTGERIIAVAGTDEGKDLMDYPNVGRRQWGELQGEVTNYIARQPQDAQVELTGHSLGGAVVQYAAYDLKNPQAAICQARPEV